MLKHLEAALRLPPLPKRWRTHLSHCQEFPFFLQETWLLEMNDRYQLFSKHLPLVLDAAKAAQRNPNLTCYINLLYEAMKNRACFQEDMKTLMLPEADPAQESLGFDLAPLLAMLPHLCATIDRLFQMGIPESVIRSTYVIAELTLELNTRRLGRPMYDLRYFQWLQRHIDGTLFRIGVLEYELLETMGGYCGLYRCTGGSYAVLAEKGRFGPDGRIIPIPVSSGEYTEAQYRETEAYYEGLPVDSKGNVCCKPIRLNKGEWERVCGPESAAVGVHIPRGVKLTRDNLRKSYTDAMALLSQYFPDFSYQAFCCHSWLLDSQLSQLLPENSNILTFQSDFLLCPMDGMDAAIFIFLYPHPYEDWTQLPEKTSLERSVKRHLLSGNHIYELQGLIPATWLQEHTSSENNL